MAALIAAGIGPLLVVLGNAVVKVIELRAWFVALGESLPGVAARLSALSASLSVGPIPGGAVVLALVALAAVLMLAYRHSAEVRKVVSAGVREVRERWDQLVKATRPFVGVVTGLVSHGRQFRSVAGSAVDFVKGHWRSLLAAMGPLGVMIDVVTKHFGTFRAVGSSAIGVARSLIMSARTKVSTAGGAVASMADGVHGAISPIGAAITTAIGWLGKIHWPSPPGWARSVANAVGGAAGYLGVTGGSANGSMQTPAGLRLVGERGPELVRTAGNLAAWRPGEDHPMHGGYVPGMRASTRGPAPRVIVQVNTNDSRPDQMRAREMARLAKPHLSRVVTIG